MRWITFISSDGETKGSPKYYRKAQRALTREQRKLRHKKPGNRNYEKQKIRIARRQAKTASQRKDFLHKANAAIAKQYDLATVKSLNMRSMSNKGFRNGKATLDNGYGMFLDMLEHNRPKPIVFSDLGRFAYILPHRHVLDCCLYFFYYIIFCKRRFDCFCSYTLFILWRCFPNFLFYTSFLLFLFFCCCIIYVQDDVFCLDYGSRKACVRG